MKYAPQWNGQQESSTSRYSWSSIYGWCVSMSALIQIWMMIDNLPFLDKRSSIQNWMNEYGMYGFLQKWSSNNHQKVDEWKHPLMDSYKIGLKESSIFGWLIIIRRLMNENIHLWMKIECGFFLKKKDNHQKLKHPTMDDYSIRSLYSYKIIQN